MQCYKFSYRQSYIESQLQRKDSLIHAMAVYPGDVNNANEDNEESIDPFT